MPESQSDPLVDSVNDVATNTIGRTIAFVLTPILLPVVGALSVWLQDVVGIDMPPATLVGFVVSVVAGVALLGYKWLHNRGEYEKAIIELHKLYEAGHALVEQSGGAPTSTGGGSDIPPPPEGDLTKFSGR